MSARWTWFEYIGRDMTDLSIRIYFGHDRRIARRMSRMFGRKFSKSTSKSTAYGHTVYVFNPVTR